MYICIIPLRTLADTVFIVLGEAISTITFQRTSLIL